MAKKNSFRAAGKSHEPTTMPSAPSLIGAFPYYPNLRRALRSHGAALLVTYLETFHSVSQDATNQRVEIEISRTLRDLQLSPRAFWRYSSYMSVRHRTPAALAAAQRTGREFTTNQVHVSGALKPYSITRTRPGYMAIRRNWPRLVYLLQGAGVIGQISEQNCGTGWSNADRYTSFCQRNASQIAALEAESPKAAAAALAKSLRKYALEADRVCSFSPRRPWNAERRARYEATIALKRANRSK